MTPLHLVFIPGVFLVGVIVGVLARAPRSAEAPDVRPLLVAASLFVLVFSVTHILPLAGGPVQLKQLLQGQPLFDQHPLFSVAEVHSRLEAMNVVGRLAYQRFTYTSDLAFPLSLLGLLVFSARHVRRRFAAAGIGASLSVAAPWLWFGLDMLENAIIFQVIEAYPAFSSVSGVLGGVTVAKFAALGASVLIPMALAVQSLRVQRVTAAGAAAVTSPSSQRARGPVGQ